MTYRLTVEGEGGKKRTKRFILSQAPVTDYWNAINRKENTEKIQRLRSSKEKLNFSMRFKASKISR